MDAADVVLYFATFPLLNFLSMFTQIIESRIAPIFSEKQVMGSTNVYPHAYK